MFNLVTAYKQYGLEGHGLDGTDYLVKLYSMCRFFKPYNKAKELHRMKIANKQLPIYRKAGIFYKSKYLDQVMQLTPAKDNAIL